MLDAFSYHGSFALHAARSAAEVVGRRRLGGGIGRAGRANAERNEATNLTFVEANAFEDLRARERRRERFDLVLLDPPGVREESRRRRGRPARLQGAQPPRAPAALAPGGVLVTSSCSYNLDEASFEAFVREAAADAGADVTRFANGGDRRPIIPCGSRFPKDAI